jgi:hypothetical protein
MMGTLSTPLGDALFKTTDHPTSTILDNSGSSNDDNEERLIAPTVTTLKVKPLYVKVVPVSRTHALQ